MSALSSILRSVEGGKVAFWCPGCNEAHAIGVGTGDGPRWGYNGNPDAPTFTPSVLVRGFQKGRDEHGKWNGEWVRGPDGKALPGVCHSFVTDGKIQFLGDCTHALANQTVPLPPFDGDEG